MTVAIYQQQERRRMSGGYPVGVLGAPVDESLGASGFSRIAVGAPWPFAERLLIR